MRRRAGSPPLPASTTTWLNLSIPTRWPSSCARPDQRRLAPLTASAGTVQPTRPGVELRVEHAELRVRRLQLLHRRLQLLVGRLQLLVRRLQLLVGRLQLLVGRLELLVGRLQLLDGGGVLLGDARRLLLQARLLGGVDRVDEDAG